MGTSILSSTGTVWANHPQTGQPDPIWHVVNCEDKNSLQKALSVCVQQSPHYFILDCHQDQHVAVCKVSEEKVKDLCYFTFSFCLWLQTKHLSDSNIPQFWRSPRRFVKLSHKETLINKYSFICQQWFWSFSVILRGFPLFLKQKGPLFYSGACNDWIKKASPTSYPG